MFDTKLGRLNVDIIRDFNIAHDTIWLSRSVFGKAGRPGKRAEKAFRIGQRAHDSTDRIVYSERTGALFYDPDGTGRAAAVHFATLKKGLALTEADFQIT